jgi:hypothetical protein
VRVGQATTPAGCVTKLEKKPRLQEISKLSYKFPDGENRGYLENRILVLTWR